MLCPPPPPPLPLSLLLLAEASSLPDSAPSRTAQRRSGVAHSKEGGEGCCVFACVGWAGGRRESRTASPGESGWRQRQQQTRLKPTCHDQPRHLLLNASDEAEAAGAHPGLRAVGGVLHEGQRRLPEQQRPATKALQLGG